MGPEYPSSALGNQEAMRIKVAAAGDIHCSEEERVRLQQAFAAADRQADIILLAGDLTTYGEPEQGAVLADLARDVETPIFAVLGNHDWHADRHEELAAALPRRGDPAARTDGGDMHRQRRRGRNRRDQGLRRRVLGLAATRFR